MPIRFKVKRADIVLDNSGTLSDLLLEIEKITIPQIISKI